MSIFSPLSRHNKNESPVRHEHPAETYTPLPEGNPNFPYAKPLDRIDRLDWPYLRLALELDKIDKQKPIDEQMDLEKTIIDDAEALVAQILPRDMASSMNISPQYDGEEPLEPTSRDAFLLAETMDKTHAYPSYLDKTLDYILEHLNETSPGQLGDLETARSLAKSNNTSIMYEYNQIRAKQDNSHDLPKTLDELEFPMDVREHTPPELLTPTWEKMLQEREKEKDD